jgi:hypothetical protein
MHIAEVLTNKVQRTIGQRDARIVPEGRCTCTRGWDFKLDRIFEQWGWMNDRRCPLSSSKLELASGRPKKQITDAAC